MATLDVPTQRRERRPTVEFVNHTCVIGNNRGAYGGIAVDTATVISRVVGDGRKIDQQIAVGVIQPAALTLKFNQVAAHRSVGQPDRAGFIVDSTALSTCLPESSVLRHRAAVQTNLPAVIVDSATVKVVVTLGVVSANISQEEGECA